MNHNHTMNNLERYRELRGWSQRDLADVLGVSQPTIQRAEKEDPSAKLETYKKCAEALGVTLADLFSDHSAVESDLVSLYRNSDPDAQARLMQIVQAALSLPEKSS